MNNLYYSDVIPESTFIPVTSTSQILHLTYHRVNIYK